MSRERDLVIDANTLDPLHAKRGRKFNPSRSNAAPVLFAGLFEAGTGGYELWNTTSWSDFTSRWAAFGAQGEQLVSFDSVEHAGVTWYLGAWQQIAGGGLLWRFADWPAFLHQFQTNAGNYRLVTLDIHPTGGSRYYTGAWIPGATPQTIVHDLPWDQFVAQWKTHSEQGWRLTCVQVYPSAGPDLFTGVFERGGGGYALLVEASWAAFDQYYQANKATMRLVDFQVYDSGATRCYVGVWRETTARHEFVTGLDWGSFTSVWQQLAAQGLRLKRVVTYPNHVELPKPQWMKTLAAALGTAAEGYAYAVAHNGTLVESGGVHNARSGQNPPVAHWTTSVRINLASVSKAVTAVAVLKLLGDKHLSVDDPFSPAGAGHRDHPPWRRVRRPAPGQYVGVRRHRADGPGV